VTVAGTLISNVKDVGCTGVAQVERRVYSLATLHKRLPEPALHIAGGLSLHKFQPG